MLVATSDRLQLDVELSVIWVDIGGGTPVIGVAGTTPEPAHRLVTGP